MAKISALILEPPICELEVRTPNSQTALQPIMKPYLPLILDPSV